MSSLDSSWSNVLSNQKHPETNICQTKPCSSKCKQLLIQRDAKVDSTVEDYSPSNYENQPDSTKMNQFINGQVLHA